MTIHRDKQEKWFESENFLPQDYARCSNEKCERRLSCARFLDVLPFEEGYMYAGFNEIDCKFYKEKKGITPIKKSKKK